MYRVYKRVVVDGDYQEKLIFETLDKENLNIWLRGYYSAYEKDSIRIVFEEAKKHDPWNPETMIFG
jgi:hypothetical protein